MRAIHLTCFLSLVALACGPSSTGPIPSYPPKSDLAGSGQRCHGDQCSCRPLIGGDQEERTPPPAGKKRFEIRIPVTVHPVWINVAGAGTFYKPAERGDETCYYVDLAPGEHRVTYVIRERNPQQGFGAILRISEYGSKTKAWYETFLVDCGTADGVCTKGLLEEWIKGIHKRKGLVDSCSSTKFQQTTWNSNEWQGGQVQELLIATTLKVYKFEPTRAPGSHCRGQSHQPAAGGTPAPSDGTKPDDDHPGEPATPTTE